MLFYIHTAGKSNVDTHVHRASLLCLMSHQLVMLSCKKPGILFQPAPAVIYSIDFASCVTECNSAAAAVSVKCSMYYSVKLIVTP